MITITYKTSMADNTFEHENHSVTAENYFHAIAIAQDLEQGDFGDITCFDILIHDDELEETIDDLPF